MSSSRIIHPLQDDLSVSPEPSPNISMRKHPRALSRGIDSPNTPLVTSAFSFSQSSLTLQATMETSGTSPVSSAVSPNQNAQIQPQYFPQSVKSPEKQNIQNMSLNSPTDGIPVLSSFSPPPTEAYVSYFQEYLQIYPTERVMNVIPRVLFVPSSKTKGFLPLSQVSGPSPKPSKRACAYFKTQAEEEETQGTVFRDATVVVWRRLRVMYKTFHALRTKDFPKVLHFFSILRSTEKTHVNNLFSVQPGCLVITSAQVVFIPLLLAHIHVCRKQIKEHPEEIQSPAAIMLLALQYKTIGKTYPFFQNLVKGYLALCLRIRVVSTVGKIQVVTERYPTDAMIYTLHSHLINQSVSFQIEQASSRNLKSLHSLGEGKQVSRKPDDTLFMEQQSQNLQPIDLNTNLQFQNLSEKQAYSCTTGYVSNTYSSPMSGLSGYLHTLFHNTASILGSRFFGLHLEYERLGFQSHSFCLTETNADWSICSTYPRMLPIPSSCEEGVLQNSAKHRQKNRFPVICWKYSKDQLSATQEQAMDINGAVLLRSSQPYTGVSGVSCPADEQLVQEYINAGWSRFSASNVSKDCGKLVILDLRAQLSASGQSFLGGGSEDPVRYHAEVLFCDIPNIHAARKTYLATLSLISELNTPSTDCGLVGSRLSTILPSFYTSQSKTGYFDILISQLRAAQLAASLITEGISVLVHCTDGHDRTPTITALIQVLLDPYYRTIPGFISLIEKEWLAFGHKFEARIKHNSDENSPTFLFFLDCVYQILRQQPQHFEFRENLLSYIAKALYEQYYATFYKDNELERVQVGLPTSGPSLWTFIHAQKHEFISPDYTHTLHTLPINLFALSLWTNWYLQPIQPSMFTSKQDYHNIHNIYTKNKPTTNAYTQEQIDATIEQVLSGTELDKLDVDTLYTILDDHPKIFNS